MSVLSGMSREALLLTLTSELAEFLWSRVIQEGLEGGAASAEVKVEPFTSGRVSLGPGLGQIRAQVSWVGPGGQSGVWAGCFAGSNRAPELIAFEAAHPGL